MPPEIEISKEQRENIEQWIDRKTEHHPVVYSFGDQAHNINGEPVVLFQRVEIVRNPEGTRGVHIIGDSLLTSDKIVEELNTAGILSQENAGNEGSQEILR